MRKGFLQSKKIDNNYQVVIGHILLRIFLSLVFLPLFYSLESDPDLKERTNFDKYEVEQYDVCRNSRKMRDHSAHGVHYRNDDDTARAKDDPTSLLSVIPTSLRQRFPAIRQFFLDCRKGCVFHLLE